MVEGPGTLGSNSGIVADEADEAGESQAPGPALAGAVVSGQVNYQLLSNKIARNNVSFLPPSDSR